MSASHDPVTFEVLEGNIQLLAEKERLEQEKRRLQELDRLKTEFLARVSHDLRTPLNSILGFSELLLAEAGGRLSKRHHEYVSAIHRNGHALLALLGDFLDLASLESGHINLRREPLPLTTLLADLRAATEPLLASAKLEVTWPDPATLAGKSAMVDRRRMSQALVNLVDNARKYTPPGGTVTIAMDADAETATFIIADTGPGIPEQDLDRVFIPFFQRNAETLRRGSGVGLGLAIVRGIVELHRGQIVLDSGPGRGTRFRLLVPQVLP